MNEHEKRTLVSQELDVNQKRTEQCSITVKERWISALGRPLRLSFPSSNSNINFPPITNNLKYEQALRAQKDKKPHFFLYSCHIKYGH